MRWRRGLAIKLMPSQEQQIPRRPEGLLVMTTQNGPMTTQIKFGTDGWRGIIADDFTFDNVRRVGNAMAHYVHKHEDAEQRPGRRIRHALRLATRGGDYLRNPRRRRHCGPPVERLHAHSSAFVRGEEPGHGGRRHDHLQPQSLQLEWREVQGQLRRIGHAGDHARHRRRTGIAAPGA